MTERAREATDWAPSDSDEALVTRLCEGEKEALRTLMVRHAAAIEGFCRCYVDRDAAQDATQETFVRVLQRCHTMRGGKAFKPWLYAIARNVCVSMLRRQRVRATLPLEAVAEAAEPPHEAVADRQQHEAALRAVNSLPEHYRDVVIMHFLLDFTCEEVGAALGLSAGAVRVRLHRAMTRVRKSLAQEGMLP